MSCGRRTKSSSPSSTRVIVGLAHTSGGSRRSRGSACRPGSYWGAVAFAGIRELPETLQDRSIAVRLPKALPGEVRAHLSDGTSSVLRTIKAKFAAVDSRSSPSSRTQAARRNSTTASETTGDRWSPSLIWLAEDGPGSSGRRLRHRFRRTRKRASSLPCLAVSSGRSARKIFLEIQALINSLLADDEYDWSTANNSRLINAAWLRWRLRGVWHRRQTARSEAIDGVREKRSADISVTGSRMPGRGTHLQV